MAEELCQVGDVRLCYETFGAPRDPALLLVMGLGTQMVAWHEDFCAELVVEVTFDHVSDGRIRHGTKILRWRDDKQPAECRIEQMQS